MTSSLFDKLIVLFVSYFTPIAEIVHVMLILLTLDTISGIIASLKSGEKLQSHKLRRTVFKFLWYTIAVMCAWMMEKTFSLSWSNLANIIAGFVCFVEFKSILENITRITNEPIFHRLLRIFRRQSTKTIDEIIDGETDEEYSPRFNNGKAPTSDKQ